MRLAPHLVDTTEIRQTWGWSRQRVLRYEKKGLLQRQESQGRAKVFLKEDFEHLVTALENTPTKKKLDDLPTGYRQKAAPK